MAQTNHSKWATWGSVRGLGPVRSLIGSAIEDLERDRIDCRSQGGYSDRELYAVDADGYVIDPDTGANVYPYGRTHHALKVRKEAL